jgi:hypothetical protein
MEHIKNIHWRRVGYARAGALDRKMLCRGDERRAHELDRSTIAVPLSPPHPRIRARVLADTLVEVNDLAPVRTRINNPGCC